MPPEDAELIESCLAGRLSAFDELVRRYQNVLYSVCLRLLGQREEALDAAQEAFVRAFVNLARFDRSREFRPWLLRIGVNICLDVLRTRRRRPLSTDLHAPADDLLPSERRAGAHGTQDPQKAVEASQLRARLNQALQSLPVTYRAVAVLRHAQGLSYEEIAQVTGLPLGTVKTHLFRAKKLLREKLADWLG